MRQLHGDKISSKSMLRLTGPRNALWKAFGRSEVMDEGRFSGQVIVLILYRQFLLMGENRFKLLSMFSKILAQIIRKPGIEKMQTSDIFSFFHSVLTLYGLLASSEELVFSPLLSRRPETS